MVTRGLLYWKNAHFENKKRTELTFSVPESLYQITFPLENDTPQGMHWAVSIMHNA